MASGGSSIQGKGGKRRGEQGPVQAWEVTDVSTPTNPGGVGGGQQGGRVEGTWRVGRSVSDLDFQP